MRNFDASKGDRVDSVAQLCRRLYLRTELCPCLDSSCVQCKNDHELIETVELAFRRSRNAALEEAARVLELHISTSILCLDITEEIRKLKEE